MYENKRINVITTIDNQLISELKLLQKLVIKVHISELKVLQEKISNKLIQELKVQYFFFLLAFI